MHQDLDNSTHEESLEREEMFKTGYLYAIKLLTKRDYSKFKLKMKLASKSVNEDVADEIIEYLVDKKFLNEENYIEGRVKSLMLKGYSKEYIVEKLYSEQLQCSTQIIDGLFEEYKFSEEIQITHLLEKKLRGHSVKDLIDFNFRKKLLRYFVSKGHSIDDTNKVMEDFLRRDDDFDSDH
jgi:regulatory protein